MCSSWFSTTYTFSFFVMLSVLPKLLMKIICQKTISNLYSKLINTIKKSYSCKRLRSLTTLIEMVFLKLHYIQANIHCFVIWIFNHNHLSWLSKTLLFYRIYECCSTAGILIPCALQSFLFISPLTFSILHKNMLSKSVLAYLGITAIYATNQHSLTLNTWWEAIMLHNKNIKQKLFRSSSFICLYRRETSPPYIRMRQHTTQLLK